MRLDPIKSNTGVTALFEFEQPPHSLNEGNPVGRPLGTEEVSSIIKAVLPNGRRLIQVAKGIIDFLGELLAPISWLHDTRLAFSREAIQRFSLLN